MNDRTVLSKARHAINELFMKKDLSNLCDRERQFIDDLRLALNKYDDLKPKYKKEDHIINCYISSLFRLHLGNNYHDKFLNGQFLSGGKEDFTVISNDIKIESLVFASKQHDKSIGYCFILIKKFSHKENIRGLIPKIDKVKRIELGIK